MLVFEKNEHILVIANGIKTILQDENTVYENPVFTTTIGGVKLIVKESDYKKAIEIFNESEQKVYFF